MLQRVVEFLPIEQLYKEKSHTVKAVSRAWRTAARRALTRFDADAAVNPLLAAHGSPWRIEGQDGWGDAVTVSHLIDHSALGLHYVPGVPSTEQFPTSLELVSGRAEKWGYAAVECVKKPGSAFAYSGGGFLVLQHLLECALGPEKAKAEPGFLTHSTAA